MPYLMKTTLVCSSDIPAFCHNPVPITNIGIQYAMCETIFLEGEDSHDDHGLGS
jgi:hypothetical protein